MGNNVFVKDPDATLPYTVDWSAWLEGDAIDSVEWFPCEGMTIIGQSHSNTRATVKLSGGVEDTPCRVRCRITTVGGLVDQRDMFLLIQRR